MPNHKRGKANSCNLQLIPMSNSWITWTANRTKFLAVDNGDGWHVMDEKGENFGAWQDLRTFKELQRKRDPNGFLGFPGSKAKAVIRVL